MNPWAEKLQEVQLPDANDSWSAMAVLLDKEMPVARPQDRRRWLLLVLLLLLLIGVCNCPRLGHRFQRAQNDPTRAGSPSKTSSSTSSSSTASPSPTSPSETSSSPSSPATASSSPASPSVVSRSATSPSPVSPSASSPSTASPSAAGHPVPAATAPRPLSGSPDGHSDHRTKDSPNPHTPSKRGTPAKPGAPAIAGGAVSTHSEEITTAGSVTHNKKPPVTSAPATQKTGGSTGTTAGLPNPKPVDSAGKISGDLTTKKPDSSGKKPGATAAKKPAPSLKKPADSMAIKKADKDKPGEEDDVKGLVVGIGLNQFFSVGQQQKSDYNSGGTSGGIGDYIPVPMARYYFSRKLYVQLEAQFNTPQYTKKDLVGGLSKADTLSPGRVQQNSVIIKKLFYFNLPLSIHYSPLKNLYLGAGLQYSRLSNGVGVLQNKVITTGASDSIKSATVYNIKGDSVYQKMRTNEFRVLFDVNYTYKRFILGVRYNQALSKFLDVRISDTKVTQARNSSLQLYARYILWDHRKKKVSPSK